jgi:hypothetical protein
MPAVLKTARRLISSLSGLIAPRSHELSVAIALVVSLGVLALAAPVMAAAADVERCSGLAGLWRDIARARDKGVSADVLRAKVDATKDTSADAKAKMDGAVTMIYGHPEFTPDQVAAAVLESCLGE